MPHWERYIKLSSDPRHRPHIYEEQVQRKGGLVCDTASRLRRRDTPPLSMYALGGRRILRLVRAHMT
jgi:hypothetical protein